MNEIEALFQHSMHPRTRHHLEGTMPPPPKVDDLRMGWNGKLGLLITTRVGTMWAAYLFSALAVISLPSAIRSGNSIIIVSWIAQTFLQLVLLPIIIVGQNIQATASDRRANETYNDAEAVLHESVQIQAHLTAQDRAQQAQIAELKSLIAELKARLPDSTQPR